MALKSLTPSISLFKSAGAGVLLALCVAPMAQAQEFTRVGFVDNERILRESLPAKAAQARIEQEFSKRNKEVEELGQRVKAMSEKFDKDAPGLPDTDRLRRQRELIDVDKDFQRKKRELNEDAVQRGNEERAQFFDRANKVVKQIAEAEKIDIVFQEGVYVNPKIDLTDKVLKALNK